MQPPWTQVKEVGKALLRVPCKLPSIDECDFAPLRVPADVVLEEAHSRKSLQIQDRLPLHKVSALFPPPLHKVGPPPLLHALSS